ncbi:MAG: SMP-30/gluconolactonase/LRE family protein [Steroidobacteraceae bacterium]|nr:SMP-30/gluconolactonase/LRE family protein [Steroidobacteraceae bacterium]
MDICVVSGDIRCELGEGPLWDGRRNQVYWVDILAPAIHRLNIADGALRSWRLPENIGWVIPREGRETFIAGLRSGFTELTLDPFVIRTFGPIPELVRNERLRMNDAKADSRGRIFAGTMDMDGIETGNLYRLDGEQSWVIVDSGYGIPNGPTFSPSGDVIYHADTKRRLVYQFAVGEDGNLSNKRPFVAFPEEWGVPDGMTADVDGCVWIAHWGGSRVSRFTPAGALDRAIHLPTPQITSCVFAGPALRRMYVTSAALGIEGDPLAGAVFEVDPGCQGIAAHAFAG